MYIRRDYSGSFFGPQKKRRNTFRLFFIFGLAIGALGVYVYANFETLQEKANAMMGNVPTATPLPSDLATLGVTLVLQGDLQAAADLFERAIAQRPDNIDYLHEYGKVLLELGEAEQSLALGDRILDLNPTDPRGYALRAQALVWLSRPSEAIPAALAGLSVNDRYAPLYAALARAYTNTGRYIDGVEAGESAVEVDPASIEARRGYAYALTWVGRNAEATAQLEIALALDERYLPTYFELAVQYLAQDRDQEAIDLYDRILAIQPRNARALLRLCGTYRKVGQFERALGYCEDAAQNDPTSVGANYQLGLLRYNNFDFNGAVESFTQCLEYDSENLDCTYRLGLSYYYLDNCDAAWTVLQQALVMARGRPGTETAIAHIQEGLVAVSQACPQYGGQFVQPEITPELEITPGD